MNNISQEEYVKAYMESYQHFMRKLFGQLAQGKTRVNVNCADNKVFEADVTGYSEEYMTINVRFVSDDLTKPGVVYERPAWGIWNRS